MNDFDFDALSKKRIARSAARKKCGSKSKKCSLPSDHMTAAEWKRRNGPVITYNLNKPMDWETFKNMPLTVQQEYLNTLHSRFNVGANAVSSGLFGKSTPALHQYLNKTGLTMGRGKKLTALERCAWADWCLNNTVDCESREEPDDEIEGEISKPDVADETPVDSIAIESRSDDFGIKNLSATFAGEFDACAFIHWMGKLPIPEGHVTIRVEVIAE